MGQMKNYIRHLLLLPWRRDNMKSSMQPPWSIFRIAAEIEISGTKKPQKKLAYKPYSCKIALRESETEEFVDIVIDNANFRVKKLLRACKETAMKYRKD
jgi:hypothetical protein